jgi:transposase
VVFGVLNPVTGTRFFGVATRNGGADFRRFLQAVRGTYRRWDILMLLDHGSSHTAQETRHLAATLRIRFGWLPTACPELNPLELLWEEGKQAVCANRAYADVDEQALHFLAHLTALTPAAALQRAGVWSENFWLPT